MSQPWHRATADSLLCTHRSRPSGKQVTNTWYCASEPVCSAAAAHLSCRYLGFQDCLDPWHALMFRVAAASQCTLQENRAGQ